MDKFMISTIILSNEDFCNDNSILLQTLWLFNLKLDIIKKTIRVDYYVDADGRTQWTNGEGIFIRITNDKTSKQIKNIDEIPHHLVFIMNVHSGDITTELGNIIGFKSKLLFKNEIEDRVYTNGGILRKELLSAEGLIETDEKEYILNDEIKETLTGKTVMVDIAIKIEKATKSDDEYSCLCYIFELEAKIANKLRKAYTFGEFERLFKTLGEEDAAKLLFDELGIDEEITSSLYRNMIRYARD